MEIERGGQTEKEWENDSSYSMLRNRAAFVLVPHAGKRPHQ